MVLKTFLYITTIFITHHIAAFIQAYLHCLLGHRKSGGSICRTHLYNHHGIYSAEVMVSEKYIDEARSLDSYYIVPGGILILLAYLILPYDLFWIHTASLILSIGAHLYLHTRYHLRDSWLHRFAWFRRKQQLHLIHHKDMAKNFAVVEFVWDRVMGTFADAYGVASN